MNNTLQEVEKKLAELRIEYRSALALDRQIIIRRAKALNVLKSHLLKLKQ